MNDANLIAWISIFVVFILVWMLEQEIKGGNTMKICIACGELVPQGCCTCGPRQRILQRVDPQEIAKDLIDDWEAPFYIMDGRGLNIGVLAWMLEQEINRR